MSSELQILRAFETWRDVARQIHGEEALPNGEELVAAARDHTELDVDGNYPALQVWADALKNVRALALTENTEVIPYTEGLYQPNFHPVLDADLVETPTPEIEDADFEEAVPRYVAETTGPRHAAAEPEPEPEPEIEFEPELPLEPDVVEQFDVDARDYQPHEFRLLDGFSDAEQIPGADLRVRPTGDGGLELEWSLPSWAQDLHGFRDRIFRVVSNEEEFDKDPEFGEPRAVTVGHRWVDREPLSTAYRLYQVWMHEGSSESAALRSEPKLVGEQPFIRPINNIELSATGSVVKGQWSPDEHTHRVAVFAAKASERRTNSRKNEIAVDTQNLQGFRFSPQNKGVEYKFVAQRYVLIHGEQHASAPSEDFSIYVNAEVVDVPIQVDESDDGFETKFNVNWENPDSGEVRIYRTVNAPTDGLHDRVVEVDQLESFGLPQRDWANDLERGMTSCWVDWPEDWYSVFITPVSVVGGQAKVGRSHSRVRVGDIVNPRLHERVNNQFLTFGWPDEAHEVTAVFGELGAGHEVTPRPDSPGSNIASIHREAYEREGGMRVQLPAAGDVALFPSRVYEGRQIWGDPRVLHYDGVQQFSYVFTVLRGRLSLVIYSDREDTSHRQFTLRIQQGRLPLEPDDGVEIKTRRITTEGSEDADYLPGINSGRLHPDQYTEYWEVDPAVFQEPQGGLLRVFVREDHQQGTPVTALIDPNPTTLYLDEWRQHMSGTQQ